MADETNSPIVSFNNAHHFISIKLTPTNYLFWSTQITLFLKGQNLMGFVDGTHHCPPSSLPNYTQWVRQDQLIMSLVIASLSEDVFSMVIGLRTSRDIWVTLEKALASPSNTGQIQLHMNLQSNEDGDHNVTHMDPGLYKSARVGDLDVLRLNMDRLHLQLTPCKNTLLHVLAQFHDNAECVHEILVPQSTTIKQSMLTSKNSNGETVLHIAARNGRLNIVRELIQHAKALGGEELESGANIAEEMMRATDQNGDTALHVAVRNNYADVVKLLVEEDPDFTHPSNKMEETPLYLAVESHSHPMVEAILTTCKSPGCRGPGGLTALHAAVLRNCEGCTGQLLTHNQALTKEVDKFGWSPLHYAARRDYVWRAKQLLEADRSAAYIMANKDDNKTPLHIAAWQGKVRVMKEILDHCPDCWEMTTSKGQNVVHLAASYGGRRVLDFVMSNSWATNLINEKDAEGNTPLHVYASSIGLHGKPLLRHPDVDKNAFNNKNFTPVGLTRFSKGLVLFKFLRRRQIRKSGGNHGFRNAVAIDNDNYNRWKEAAAKRGEPRKSGNTYLVVATLIATVTFAAGFTVPGGYDNNKGPNQGMAVLVRKTAFKAFVVSDTIALICSMLVVILHFAASTTFNTKRFATESELVLFASIAMMVAFMSGLYTVLAPSLGLAITECFLGSLSILIFFVIIYVTMLG